MKINYGIYIGSTSASIARMQEGEPTILKSDTLKDNIPLCVYINRKKAIQVGDSAFNAFKREQLKAFRGWESSDNNSFLEFNRTLGTDAKYYSSNYGKSFTSEELVAEVIKTLISFEKNHDIRAAVITVPDGLKITQINGIRRAGELAGLSQVEILQESVASSLGYGLDAVRHQGYSLVFSFHKKNFDVSLIKKGNVIDTEGNSYLGGVDLDFAIIDKIIMSYLEDNYSIDSILRDNRKKQTLRNAVKYYAEEAKIKLSFNDSHNILSDLGDIPGEDDDGEEFELDILVTQQDITKVLSPVFQKAIDLSKSLLNRNNLTGNSLDALILVGGSTFSPVLRQMLEQQICKPNTSIDPKTVVAKGAALYASTIDVSEAVREETRDRSKIQIEVDHEASTIEKDEFVTIKILEEKTEGKIPTSVFAEVIRGDKAWSSGKVEISAIGEVVDVQLVEDKTNVFDVILYDSKGNILDSEPGSFNIVQGSVVGSATLPYHIGIEIKDRLSGKIVFSTVEGLEKNKSLPARGLINSIKTKKEIRPGVESDFVKIPIFQGEHGAEGTRAIYNEHVYDIIINGNDLPTLLPENSEVDLTIDVDKSQKISVQAYFPYLDYKIEIEVPERTTQSIETTWLANEIRKAKGSVSDLKSRGNVSSELKAAEAGIKEQENTFRNNPDDIDIKMQVLSNLRKHLKVVDKLNDEKEWPDLEEQLKEEFYKLEKANTDLGNEQTTQIVNQIRTQLGEVIEVKDVKIGNIVFKEIQKLFIMLDDLLPQVTIEETEDLLFELTEYNKINSQEFKSYFEQLCDLKENKQQMDVRVIYKRIKDHE